jgi:RNA polymerase sigma-70 factor (ECF subfamily)
MRALAVEQAQEVLLARCVARDEAAWASLYSRYATTIAHFLRRLGVGADVLDDAVQEVFLQAFRSLEGFRGEAALKTWLYRLAVTQARRVRQKARFRQRVRELLTREAETELSFCEPTQGEAERLLERALAQLTPLEREAFVLYELEGERGADMAVIFGCPEATVYRRLHDARKKFQAFLESESAK